MENLEIGYTKQTGGTYRNSGIKLLKIFGIFLIVASHVVQTLLSTNQYMSSSDYILDLTLATADLQNFLLSLIYYGGVIGNTIFFISSAWFLIDSEKVNVKKWFSLFIEVWFISVLILIITLIGRSGDISFSIIIKSLLPTTFSTTWYMTCYLLFYPIHHILNKIIRGMDQRQLFGVTCILSIIYVGVNFIISGLLFWSNLVLWITLYFVISYLKIYKLNFINSNKVNIFFGL